jgi:hypothetical protein
MSKPKQIVEQKGSIVSFTGEFIKFSVNNHSSSVDDAQLIRQYIGTPGEGEKDATIIEENTHYVKCVTSSERIFYRFIHRGTFWDKSDEENKKQHEIFRSRKEDFSCHGRVFMGLFIYRICTDLALAIHLESVASCLRLGDDGIIYVVIYEDEHQSFSSVYDEFKSKQPKSGGGAKPSPRGTKPSSGSAKPSSGGAKPSSDGAKPSSDGAKPSSDGAKPSPRDTKPSPRDTKPSPRDAKPSSDGAKPSSDGAKLSPRDANPSSGGAKPSSGGAKLSSGDSDTTHIEEGLPKSFFLKGLINDPSKNNDLVSSFLREGGTYLINTTSIPKGWKEGVKTPISVTIHTGIKIPICNVTRCDSTVPLETGDVLIHVELSI